MEYSFKTPCHPTANERIQQFGDEAFRLWFPTDDGGKVTISMGKGGMIHTAGCVLAMIRDDPELMELARAEAAEILAAPMEQQ